ncbi:MAG TPA: dephospho-CoA kinase, partial [Rudaea sp.]
MNARPVVALTGGIASGKSVVSRHFEQLGVPVFDADAIARELVLPGQPALAEIASSFGPQMLTSSGTLDRARMRAVVFADENARRQLESILHPRIRAALRQRAQASQADYCVLAIPLLAEHAEDYRWVDRVLVVDAPEQIQRARLMQRDGMTIEAAQRMLDAQATRAARLALADDVID